ncbi:right-handed parallel beta-helix repeat-containing protein [Flavihumibacter solisilvae]|uniref:right-handed parallel beta-helix repeat-containing protein n=1 Tax=Flavihumibacter solisilvae TaxID=1349421 RepID=UPI000B0AD99F|nr:right-handed parallel beta-helix repeat-containing protein [Flavihumibacter solisilvae]
MKEILRYLLSLSVAIQFASCAVKAVGTNYYFDPVNGNDQHAGTDPAKPFKSLAVIRKMVFKPGDSILLKSGASFQEQLFLSAKGSEDHSIVIGKYGGDSRPYIQGDTAKAQTVWIYNSEHVVVRDLEVSNVAGTTLEKIRGVLVELHNYGKARNITLDNLYVRDIKTSRKSGEIGDGGAIVMSNFRDNGTDSVSSSFHGLVVQNCVIRNSDFGGIGMWGNWQRKRWDPNRGVIIRNNLVEGIAGHGIVPVACDGPLVEYNIVRNSPQLSVDVDGVDGIWPWSCDNAVVQYNVVSDMKSQWDAYGFDADYNCSNSLFQYNLSFNNKGGFLLVCNSGGWGPDWSVGNVGSRIRYNVSINDGLRDYIGKNAKDYFSPVIHCTGSIKQSVIEKNLVYVRKKPGPQIDRTILHLNNWGEGYYPDSTWFRDNYIYTEEPNLAVNPENSTNHFFDNNRYVGSLEVPAQGFEAHQGKFDSSFWYDSTDAHWKKLVSFLRDKKVPLDGRNVPVLELLGFEVTHDVNIFPDSAINDISNHPVGMNLNFLMDGGRFPHPERSVAEAMKDMGMKWLRYPGGEKSDLNLFGVPPYEKAMPALSRTAALDDYPGMFRDGKFVFDPLDFDEYMALCRKVNAEPVVVVPADCYLVKPKAGERVSSRDDLLKHAAEWVRYANIKKKYGVKYWMIGNESWNINNPNSTVDIYAQDVIDFSRIMKAVDPSVLIIPNGASEEFFKTVIQKAGDHIDRVCVSNYGVYDFHRGYQSYLDTARVLIWPAMTAMEAVNKYASEKQKKKLKVIVAEFGTIDWANKWHGHNDMGHAIVAFDMTGQLLSQPQVEFSCYWNTRWIENESRPGIDHDALDKDGNFNPTGQALSIWGNFMGKQMVKTNSTEPVIAYSSYDHSAKKLFVYLVNKSATPQQVNLVLSGHRASAVKSWEYAGTSSEDLKPVWQERTGVDTGKFPLSGTSITVIEMNIDK